jgi:hypothetical protein
VKDEREPTAAEMKTSAMIRNVMHCYIENCEDEDPGDDDEWYNDFKEEYDEDEEVCSAGEPERGVTCRQGKYQKSCRRFMAGVTQTKIDTVQRACASNKEFGYIAKTFQALLMSIAVQCDVADAFSPGGPGLSTPAPARNKNEYEEELAALKSRMEDACKVLTACQKLPSKNCDFEECCEWQAELCDSDTDAYEELLYDEGYGGTAEVFGIVIGSLVLLGLLIFAQYSVFKYGKQRGAAVPTRPGFVRIENSTDDDDELATGDDPAFLSESGREPTMANPNNVQLDGVENAAVYEA